MKYFTLSMLLLGICSMSFAQQAPHFSMYMLNKYQANAGYAGFDESLSATGVYRQQWVGLTGAPENIHFNVHMPLLIAGGGVGISLDTEKIGAGSATKAAFSYSYWMDLNREVKIAIGLRAGIEQRSFDGNLLRAPDGNYNGELIHNDPLLPLTKVSSMIPQFDIGIHIATERLNGGVAMANLSQGVHSFDLPEGGNLRYTSSRTLLAYVEYELEAGRYFVVKPSIMVRSDLIQQEIHFGALVEYDRRFFAGGTFRGYNMASSDAFAIIIGASLNEKLSLGYAYDITLSSLRAVSSGSHEVLLNYNLGKPIGKGKLPNIIYNPRF